MSKIKYNFKYQKAERYKRPLIPIALRFQNKKINTLALIDSGADFNVFHSDLAQLLDINLDSLKEIEFGGIKKDKEQCKGKLAVIKIGINNEFFDSPVIFSGDISDNGYGILGQNGFFDHFRVTLDYKTDNIYLKKS